jgi:hypothetical protein
MTALVYSKLLGEVSMAYEVALIAGVFFLGSGCAALLVSLQRYAHRSRMVNQLPEKPRARERARLLVHRWLRGLHVLENDPVVADDRIDRWR